MIIYNLNYLKWFYENNFMNVKINVLKKDKMEIASLDVHFCDILKPNLLST
jgi:hypothetical protein